MLSNIYAYAQHLANKQEGGFSPLIKHCTTKTDADHDLCTSYISGADGSEALVPTTTYILFFFLNR
jgi:hypothetical protein